MAPSSETTWRMLMISFVGVGRSPSRRENVHTKRVDDDFGTGRFLAGDATGDVLENFGTPPGRPREAAIPFPISRSVDRQQDLSTTELRAEIVTATRFHVVDGGGGSMLRDTDGAECGHAKASDAPLVRCQRRDP